MIRVRNHWLSVDPYMRGRMNDVKSYVPPFQLGEPMEGGAVGEVVESNAPEFAPGDLVAHMLGWRDEAVVPARAARKLPDLGAEPQQFLGILGTTGATAYFGLLDVAQAKHGDIVFVSAAAGAVGSAVVQIAKAKGMTVIGSAGGAREMRVRPLARRGPGRRLSRRPDPQGPRRGRAGRHRRLFRQCRRRPSRRGAGARAQQRAVRHLRHDRQLQQQRADAPALPHAGDRGADHACAASSCSTSSRGWTNSTATWAQWLASGAVKSRETVVDGLEAMPDAFLGLFEGANTGKMLVKL